MLPRIVAVATPVITLVLLTAVGLELQAADFRPLRERPWRVVAGVVLPAILLPLLAWLLVRLAQPAPSVAAGLLLLSISPMGGLATTYSMLARANVALAVAVAASACVAALATIPLASAALGLLGGPSSSMTPPVATLARQILIGLAPPVLLGMAIRARWPAAAARALPGVQRLGFVLLVGLVVVVLADATGRPGVAWGSALTLLMAFLLGAFATGLLAAWLVGGGADDRFVFGVAFATRNVAVAVALAMALGRHAEFLWIAAVYLLVQVPVLASAAAVRARWARS